tara:strand:+ start:368 stop:550 length:183 start_codon:yes stop_codon:yes gene_type:complete
LKRYVGKELAQGIDLVVMTRIGKSLEFVEKILKPRGLLGQADKAFCEFGSLAPQTFFLAG